MNKHKSSRRNITFGLARKNCQSLKLTDLVSNMPVPRGDAMLHASLEVISDLFRRNIAGLVARTSFQLVENIPIFDA